VLAAAQHERAPVHAPDALFWGVGAAVLRFASGLGGGVSLRRADSGSPVYNPRNIRMIAVVLSIDEKSQIQALDRTQPGLPMKKADATP
jgi:hypothetical protein